jgi:hypothetical protein
VGQIGLGNAQRAGDDLEQDLFVVVGDQRASDLAGRVEPVAAAARLVIEARVLDGVAGGGGEGDHQVLVLGVEAAGQRIDHVQLTQDDAARPDRYREERAHRRLRRRDAVEAGINRHVVETDGVGRGERRAEQSAAGGRAADTPEQLVVQTSRGEMFDRPVGGDDAQRAVLRLQEVAGRAHRPIQDGGEGLVVGDRVVCFEQASVSLGAFGAGRSGHRTAARHWIVLGTRSTLVEVRLSKASVPRPRPSTLLLRHRHPPPLGAASDRFGHSHAVGEVAWPNPWIKPRGSGRARPR